jgi:hypothetical protein
MRWIEEDQRHSRLDRRILPRNLWQADDLYEPIKQTLRLATPHLSEQLLRVE